MSTLVDKIVALHGALGDAKVFHAFGGALALAYHVGEPRGTRDIDVTVFVPPADVLVVFDALPAEVQRTDADAADVATSGQVRLFWDETPVDLFFSTHAFHDVAAAGTIEVPLGDVAIPVLGATELAVFKALYDRTKDWADIEAMLEVGTIDVHTAIGWLVDLLGPTDRRVARLLESWHTAPSMPEPPFSPG